MHKRRLRPPAMVPAITFIVSLVLMTVALPRHIAAASPQNQSPQDPLPDAPGKPSLVVVCGSCHEVDTAIGVRRTTAEWKQVIESMINRGAVASDDEFKTVLSYLSKSFGVVNVNTAPAKEIAEVLELAEREAEALVRQRTERGVFASLDELKMVPGIEPLVIDQRKDRIQFK